MLKLNTIQLKKINQFDQLIHQLTFQDLINKNIHLFVFL